MLAILLEFNRMFEIRNKIKNGFDETLNSSHRGFILALILKTNKNESQAIKFIIQN